MTKDVIDAVRTKYGAVAESGLSTAHDGVRAVAEAFGYSADECAYPHIRFSFSTTSLPPPWPIVNDLTDQKHVVGYWQPGNCAAARALLNHFREWTTMRTTNGYCNEQTAHANPYS
jgi:hypothetical protein